MATKTKKAPLRQRLRAARLDWNGMCMCPQSHQKVDHQPHLVTLTDASGSWSRLCRGHGIVVETLLDTDTFLAWSQAELTGRTF